MGTNTDPYQPVERELKITRQILEVLSEFNNPVGIVTKGQLVTRDIDILADMAAQPGRGLRVDHHARQGPGARDGAARLGAAPPAGGDPRAVGGRRPGRRDDARR